MSHRKAWRVIFYEEQDGTQPVMDYIFSGGLNEKDQAVLFNVLESLQNLGPDIQSTKMDKPIDPPIRELRKDRHRILYAQHGNGYVLIAAFLKKTQKTPPEQIELAKKRYQRFISIHPKL